MRKRTLVIGVRTLEAMMQEVSDIWIQSDAGNSPAAPLEAIYFGSFRLLLRALTPARLELVQAVKRHGPQSIRAIAKLLERDYRNVYADVQRMAQIGLLKKRSDSRYYVPWDNLRIDLTVSLDATA